MTDSVPQKLETLSAQLEGLAAAAASLGADPTVEASVRRIARSLEAAAGSLGLGEVEAGAKAIQRAADAHLARSVTNFLARIDELRREREPEDATILIVEDNRTVAAATQAYLKGPGRTMLVASHAQEALDILATRRVDLVILDLILPDRDGRDVLVQIREQASTATIPVVVLSSTESPVAKTECLAVGADEFFSKPADPKLLRAAAVEHIEVGRRRRDAVRDGLTGLPNRAGLALAFEEQQRALHRDGTPVALGVVSLSALAEVTMKLGRDAGDGFLLECCAALHEGMVGGDVLGRWETGELVALLPGRSEAEAKGLLGSLIRELLVDPVLTDVREAGIDITMKGGVTALSRGQTLHEAISDAHRSLLHARSPQSDPIQSEAELVELDTRTVLLVEDDRVTATLIHHRLVRDGHEVVSFADGALAHRWIFDRGAFDIAVLDVKVPGMDGFELLAKLRDDPRHARVPIIMLTGMGSEADVIRGLDLGANDYMLKPFSPSELLARVRRLLHEHATDGPPKEIQA
ncbi:MAG: response regulator [Gemmatimonadota bacterium]